jgi:hypothetical protein
MWPIALSSLVILGIKFLISLKFFEVSFRVQAIA